MLSAHRGQAIGFWWKPCVTTKEVRACADDGPWCLGNVRRTAHGENGTEQGRHARLGQYLILPVGLYGRMPKRGWGYGADGSASLRRPVVPPRRLFGVQLGVELLLAGLNLLLLK